MDEAAIQKKGLDYFRRILVLLYREIGVLKVGNHAGVVAKAKLSGGFIGENRKVQAKELYKISLTDPQVGYTLARYEKRTGLSLSDVHEAFRDGNWGTQSRGYAFGGPKWAEIASAAVDLGTSIQRMAWSDVERLTRRIEGLEHNNGRIVDKFKQLD